MINQELPATPQMLETRRFEVAANPTLILRNETGSIHVHGSPSCTEVVIQATRHSGLWGDPDGVTVSYAHNIEANTITVIVDGQIHAFDWGKLTFEVTVPSVATLQLKTATGSIDVGGVSGEMALSCDSGSIDVREGTISGQTQLITTTGSVTFDGAIDQRGSYRFETTTGSVNVTLHGDSAFHVDAATITGALHTNFPVVAAQHFIGHQASSDVGGAPHAAIRLRTMTGSINLYRR